MNLLPCINEVDQRYFDALKKSRESNDWEPVTAEGLGY